MNNKGFTIVELLGVIVLIAILGGLAVYSVNKVIQTSKTGSYKMYEKTILLGVENYLLDFPDKQPIGYAEKTFYLEELISNGYVDKSSGMTDVDCNNLRNDSYVLVKRSFGGSGKVKYNYKVCLMCYTGDTEVYQSPECNSIVGYIWAREVSYNPPPGITCAGEKCENLQQILDKWSCKIKKNRNDC